jgi:SEC-C motif-containing protein
MIFQTNCLCGSGLTYSQCCAPFHTGEQIPLTAEKLMRSRFVAYCLQNEAYLLATWDVSSRPRKLDLTGDNPWLHLEIVSTKKGSVNDRKGTVTFNAYFLEDGTEWILSEVSRFNKVNNRWFYRDGVVKIQSAE